MLCNYKISFIQSSCVCSLMLHTLNIYNVYGMFVHSVKFPYLKNYCFFSVKN